VPRWGPNDPRWGTRRLEAEGRHVGAVRWAFPGSRRDRRDAELLAISLIELGASAIVRVRLRLEREETDYQARAEQLRTILLDAVSHHFRSPLTGIIGSVTSILNLPERHDPSVRNEFLLIIKEQANRLSRYVDNFFSLARLESNSVEIHITQLNFEALIYDVWDRFGDVGGARRYLVVEVEADPIWSDANLLGQIFGNILENAIKYSPEASVVRVVGRTEDGRLHVDTIDEGPGAPPASIGHMFERFYRSQGVKASGLGLGLYITRSLLEMLGGSVTARNRSDGSSGLVISVELPILEPQYAQQQ
ncbi:MAG TPA: ATP-binding protein, partial [Sphingomicrobium sp.]